MDWDNFENEIQALADKIDIMPEIIIGITRGGIIPARLLSKYMGIKDMHCVGMRKIADKRIMTVDILDDLTGKRILLVEDMLETGRSLIVAKEYLESKGAEVKTACLYTMPISEIEPDYYLRQVEHVEKFPWE